MVPEKRAPPQKVRISALSETIAPYIKAETQSELSLANKASSHTDFTKATS
jgi:hypothetical protein